MRGSAVENADITIPLSSLHTLRGRVLMKTTGQSPAIAGVQLLFADSKEVARMAIAPDGEFELRYVAEDTYILRAAASSRPFSKEDLLSDDDTRVRQAVAPGIGFMFASDGPGQQVAAEMPLRVSDDMDGLTITVPDPPGWKHVSEPSDAGEKNADQPVSLANPK